MRSLLLILALVGTAGADGRFTGEQAQNLNKVAFDKALAKLKVKPITLPVAIASESQVTSDRAVVLELMTFDRRDEPAFVVDANKNVFRAIRTTRKIGRVAMTVCNVGPNRRDRLQFALPAGHTYKGEIKVAYDAYEILPQNSCR